MSQVGWEAVALVLVVAIGCGTCAYNKHEDTRAALECARLKGSWSDDTCKVKP